MFYSKKLHIYIIVLFIAFLVLCFWVFMGCLVCFLQALLFMYLNRQLVIEWTGKTEIKFTNDKCSLYNFTHKQQMGLWLTVKID